MWNENAWDTARTSPMTAPDASSLLVVISAPSGGGKTTLCEGLLAVESNLTRAITCTTRPPREGEKDGRDYYFLSKETFLRKVEAGEFLEHATVYDQRYGILKDEVLGKLRQGRDVLLNVDVQGAATIRAQARDNAELRKALVFVFLAPPSLGELETRLRQRDQDDESTIQKRLNAARREIDQCRRFDFIILSQSKARDLHRMQSILNAERLRQHRVALPPYA